MSKLQQYLDACTALDAAEAAHDAAGQVYQGALQQQQEVWRTLRPTLREGVLYVVGDQAIITVGDYPKPWKVLSGEAL